MHSKSYTLIYIYIDRERDVYVYVATIGQQMSNIYACLIQLTVATEQSKLDTTKNSPRELREADLFPASL